MDASVTNTSTKLGMEAFLRLVLDPQTRSLEYETRSARATQIMKHLKQTLPPDLSDDLMELAEISIDVGVLATVDHMWFQIQAMARGVPADTAAFATIASSLGLPKETLRAGMHRFVDLLVGPASE